MPAGRPCVPARRRAPTPRHRPECGTPLRLAPRVVWRRARGRPRALRPGRRSRRPSGLHQRLQAAPLVPVPPVIQQLGPHLELGCQGLNLLPGQDPAYCGLLELPAEDTGSLCGHRSSPRGLSPISVSHWKGSLQIPTDPKRVHTDLKREASRVAWMVTSASAWESWCGFRKIWPVFSGTHTGHPSRLPPLRPIGCPRDRLLSHAHRERPRL